MDHASCAPDALCVGEALWDRFPAGAVPGGAPANVAFHLALRGLDARVVTALGRDPEGDALAEWLAASGLDLSAVQRNALPTGAVDVEIAGDEAAYTIRQPAAWDEIVWNPGFAALAGSARWVIVGTLAQRGRVSSETIRAATRAASGRVVLDVNWRAPFDTMEAVHAVLPDAAVMKCNASEWARFADAMGWGVDEAEDELLRAFPMRLLAVTRGAEGCILRTPHRRVEARGADATPGGDPVGAGDAFTAALVAGLHRGMDLAEIGRWACGAGSRVASARGAMVPSLSPGEPCGTVRRPRVLVTAGASRAPLDGLRFISNPSTGELGARIADACAASGAEVELWTGAGSVVLPRSPSVTVRRFVTNDDLALGLAASAAGRDFAAVFHTAALGDFEVAGVESESGAVLHETKLRSDGPPPVVRLAPAAKILPRLRGWFPGARIAGWKYEMDGDAASAVDRAVRQVRECGTDACLVNGPAFGSGYGVVTGEGVLPLADRRAVAVWCAAWLDNG